MVGEDADLRAKISFVADITELSKQMKLAESVISRSIAKIQPLSNKFNNDPEVFYPLSNIVKNTEKGSARIIEMVKKTAKKTKFEFQDISRIGLFDIEKQKPQQPPFAGYAMSIMFAGMAIQRTMSQITKFGTKAFNDISHSVEGTVTASDKLDGAMKYLGYTIGSAMEPVIEWLIPIVDKVSEWVDANPKLTAGLITVATVLGTIAAVGGSLKLAYDGIVGLGVVLGIAKTQADGVSTSIGNVGSKFAAFKKTLGIGALVYVGYQLFGKEKEEPWSTADWIKNLGLATVGGYLVGGAWGALAAFAITLAVELNKESARKALEDAKTTYEMSQKIMKGTLTSAEYTKNMDKIGMGTFTVLPDAPFTNASTILDKSLMPKINQTSPISGTVNNLYITMPVENMYGTIPQEAIDPIITNIQRNISISNTTTNFMR
jgi:hypothetical protein